MRTADAIKYFGSPSALAKALGISRSAISQWSEEVPEGRAYQIEIITGGTLKAAPKKAVAA